MPNIKCSSHPKGGKKKNNTMLKHLGLLIFEKQKQQTFRFVLLFEFKRCSPNTHSTKIHNYKMEFVFIAFHILLVCII